MRRLLVAVALIGLASEAYAGDFEIPTLGGSPSYAPTPFTPAPPTYMRWSGFYGGAQAGYGSAHVDFAGATESLVAYQLRVLTLENEQHVSQWQVLQNANTGAASAGGFIGYNSQWDDVILGVELNYSKANFFAGAPSTPIRRITSAGGNTYDITVAGNASMSINDFGTARLRAGYVMKTIMPWAMVGFAAGRSDIRRSATVTGTENDIQFTPFSSSETRNNVWLYGWSVGGGIDAMVLPHVFVRAEYEYTNFTSVAGIKPSINTGRVGVGFKF